MLDLHLAPQPWRADARCQDADPELFFPRPDRPNARAVADAKAICGLCPVSSECLTEGMESINLEPDSGIYGGMTPAERILRSGRGRVTQHKADLSARNARIRKLYEQGGRSKSSIAQELGVSRPTVVAVLAVPA